MEITVRQEREADHGAISALIVSAYADVPYSDHREQVMVDRLRGSDAFVPSLSLVAEANGALAGHILFTRLAIHDGSRVVPALALAPLSVVPRFQGRGVGGRLVATGHDIAARLGFAAILVLGPGRYYARFGYEPARARGLVVPVAVRDENCRVLALGENGLAGMTGTVAFAPAFFHP